MEERQEKSDLEVIIGVAKGMEPDRAALYIQGALAREQRPEETVRPTERVVMRPTDRCSKCGKQYTVLHYVRDDWDTIWVGCPTALHDETHNYEWYHRDKLEKVGWFSCEAVTV